MQPTVPMSSPPPTDGQSTPPLSTNSQTTVIGGSGSKMPNKKFIIPIIIASTVALVLISAVIAVYVQTNKKTDAPTPTQDTQTTDDSRVTEQDVEDTSLELDKSLNSINDSTDFTSDDLSDATLGF